MYAATVIKTMWYWGQIDKQANETEQNHNEANWFLTTVKGNLVKKIVFSTNGAGNTEYTYERIKGRSRSSLVHTSHHMKQK